MVVGSLVLLAGTEWPFYLAALCNLLLFGFMACAGRQIGGSGSTFRWKPADGITERRGGGNRRLHRGADSGTV